MSAPVFYLGTHQPGWLAHAGVPLFVSRTRLASRKCLPRAAAPWALDSGGFTEIGKHGRWTVSAARYAAEVRRFRDEIGQLAWAAPMDWMCEDDKLARTGKTVAEHQRLTTENFLELRALAPDLPIVPVLQGRGAGEYGDHAEAYARAGVDLAREPVVGVGSVCRRQASAWYTFTMLSVALPGVRLHGFGVKTAGLRDYGHLLASADSLAWSRGARGEPPLPGHAHAHCGNCLDYALAWRARVVAGLEGCVARDRVMHERACA